jgi:hypothetical protein
MLMTITGNSFKDMADFLSNLETRADVTALWAFNVGNTLFVKSVLFPAVCVKKDTNGFLTPLFWSATHIERKDGVIVLL